jgi:hypothetical protein
MAYTIKGLAKANECEELSEYGLASIWQYWLDCNSCDKQSVNDFMSLRAGDRMKMLHFLYSEGYEKLANHIRLHTTK